MMQGSSGKRSGKIRVQTERYGADVGRLSRYHNVQPDRPAHIHVKCQAEKLLLCDIKNGVNHCAVSDRGWDLNGALETILQQSHQVDGTKISKN